jgi:cytochrome P450
MFFNSSQYYLQLRYLDGVIRESLRLRPPLLTHSARVTATDTEIGGVKIPADVSLL